MELTMWVGLAAGAFAVARSYLTPHRRWRWRIDRAPRRAIADVAENEVARVVGRVRATGPLLTAPLSGRPCVCFALTATRRDPPHQYVVAHGGDAAPFLLEDGTGRALVTATGAQLLLRETRAWPMQVVPAAVLEQMRLVPVRSGPLPDRLAWTEGVIVDGDTIAVLGAGTREPDPDASTVDDQSDYRSAGPTRLCLMSTRRYPLVVSDSPDTTR